MNSETLERLKKLTRLANNNPNEHEANLAARRVCKMLEEANWELATTWNDVKRTTEPWIKSTRPTTNPTNSDWVYEQFTKAQRDNFSYGQWAYSFVNETQAREERHKKRPKKTLVCSVCKKESETHYMGDPSTYRCWSCWYPENK